MPPQQKQSIRIYSEVLGNHDHISSLRADHYGALTVISILRILNIKWNLHAIVLPVHVVIGNMEVVSSLKMYYQFFTKTKFSTII